MKLFHYISILTALFISTISFSLSNVELSEMEYRYTLTLIRELNIIVSNFGTDQEQEEYETVRRNFQRAAERHYARDFITVTSFTQETEAVDSSTTSVDLFYELKLQLLDMYSNMATLYISRTKGILDGTAQEATDILIEYGKGSGLSKYFFGRPVDPLRDNKPYDADKYHYFRSRSTIENYLDSGYRYLEEARNVYLDVDYKYILTKETKTTRDLTFMIEKHRAAIITCRKAKECGIEIYKVLNLHDLESIYRKYDVSDIYVNRYPIYDDRIPEKYKVDATDNRRLIWAVEKKRIGNYDELNPDSTDETNPNNQRDDENNAAQAAQPADTPAQAPEDQQTQ